METTTKTLLQQWEELKVKQPQIRTRNAAELLGVSEAELIASKCSNSSNDVIRLEPKFIDILSEIQKLGKVMALTRNNSVVHERKGVYKNASLDNPHVGLFVGEDIDLRIFFNCWDKVFAVTEKSKDTTRYSLQFFAKNGEAIHKIYLIDEANLSTFNTIVNKYKHENQNPTETVQKNKAENTELPDSEIDVKNFQNEWINLKDTHDFFPLLKKYKLSRTQALRQAPKPNYAVKVKNITLRNLLHKVSEQDLEIMVFVGNNGMIQIHTGKAKKIVDYNEWLNVLDPDFNLHIKEPDIYESWVVRKPTLDGMVTALECFDNKGEQIIQLFGKRKPGIPEQNSWRKLIEQIEHENKI